MTRGALLLALAAAACSAGPAPDSRARALRLLDPSEVGPMLLTALEMPPAGTPIGGHYLGTGHSQRQQSYQITEAVAARWSAEGRARTERVMRLEGYLVDNVGPSSSDARRLVGIDFGLSGRVTRLDVASTGGSPPYLVETNADVAWELIDFASGAVIFGRNLRGSSRLTGMVDSSVALAIEESVRHLLADSGFRRALSLPRPEGGAVVSRGFRPLPANDEPISIEPLDLNPGRDSLAADRVRWGLLALTGATHGGFYGSGFILTRDGLALTTDQAMRTSRGGRDARARISSGVERPVRLIRSNRAMDVALVQVQCPGDCPTVDWRAFAATEPGIAVLIVGTTGDSTIVGQGIIGGRWGTFNGLAIRTPTGNPGDPVATPGTGRVFAMMSNVPGQPTALLLAEILRELNVVVGDDLKR